MILFLFYGAKAPVFIFDQGLITGLLFTHNISIH